MDIQSRLNTKTALEHLIFLSNKNVVAVCRDLEITPQQFTDWIKYRRPIPAERLLQLEQYFSVPADILTDDKRFAKRLSALGGVELEIMVVKAQMNACGSDKGELAYRMERLKAEKEKQIRIARLSAVLERNDPKTMERIDAFLDELEVK